MAGVRRRPARRAGALRAETAELPTVFVVGVAVGAASLQLRGGGARRRDPRLRAQGEAAHLQRLLRGADLLARRRRARAARPTACRSATISSASTSACWRWRSARTSGRRTARCAGAATRGRSWWSTSPPRPSASASLDPRARCSPPARRTTRRRSPTPTWSAPRRPGVRRRRLRLPERPADAGGAALPRGVDGAAWSTSTAPLRARREALHLAERLRGLPAPGDRRCRCCASGSRRRPPRDADLSGAGLAELLPAGGRSARALGARGGAGRDPRRAGAGRRRLLPEDRRLQARSASRSPAAATRC